MLKMLKAEKVRQVVPQKKQQAGRQTSKRRRDARQMLQMERLQKFHWDQYYFSKNWDQYFLKKLGSILFLKKFGSILFLKKCGLRDKKKQQAGNEGMFESSLKPQLGSKWQMLQMEFLQRFH